MLIVQAITGQKHTTLQLEGSWTFVRGPIFINYN